MIYAKTDMEEMPKGCKDCNFRKRNIFLDNSDMTGRCMVNLKEIYCGKITRPEWCPLIEIKES